MDQYKFNITVGVVGSNREVAKLGLEEYLKQADLPLFIEPLGIDNAPGERRSATVTFTIECATGSAEDWLNEYLDRADNAIRRAGDVVVTYEEPRWLGGEDADNAQHSN